MIISCHLTNIENLQLVSREALALGSISAYDCERLLSKMESICPAIHLAALHYRPIQRQLLVLKSSWAHGKRKSDQIIKLSSKSFHCLSLWVSPTGFQRHSSTSIRELTPTTEANLEMCGAHNSKGKFFQMAWTE